MTQPLDWYYNENTDQDLANNSIGRIPQFVSLYDPRSAHEQLDAYSGSGWNPELPGLWSISSDLALIYPGLPPTMPIASAYLRGEQILIYPAGWVCIMQLNGSYSIARIY